MLEILGLFLQAASAHILYLTLRLETGSFPRPLRAEEERMAFAAAKEGDRAARERLIRHNLRLVAHVAKKYYAAASAQEDMVSIGTIGLIKAVDSFDPARRVRFSSYASQCIENAILTGKHPSNCLLSGRNRRINPDSTPLQKTENSIFRILSVLYLCESAMERCCVCRGQSNSLPPDARY